MKRKQIWGLWDTMERYWGSDLFFKRKEAVEVCRQYMKWKPQDHHWTVRRIAFYDPAQLKGKK